MILSLEKLRIVSVWREAIVVWCLSENWWLGSLASKRSVSGRGASLWLEPVSIELISHTLTPSILRRDNLLTNERKTLIRRHHPSLRSAQCNAEQSSAASKAAENMKNRSLWAMALIGRGVDGFGRLLRVFVVVGCWDVNCSLWLVTATDAYLIDACWSL